MSLLLLAAAAAAQPAPVSTAGNSGYETAGRCLKAVISASLYEKLLNDPKAGSAATENEGTYKAWWDTFRNIFRWEGKKLGKSDAQMMADIKAITDDLKTTTASKSSNVLVDSYKQSVTTANRCRDLY